MKVTLIGTLKLQNVLCLSYWTLHRSDNDIDDMKHLKRITGTRLTIGQLSNSVVRDKGKFNRFSFPTFIVYMEHVCMLRQQFIEFWYKKNI